MNGFFDPGTIKGTCAAEGNLRSVADEDFALNAMRWEEPVFCRAPTTAHGHAAGDEAKKLGEFTTRYVLRLDTLDREIDFGRGPLREIAG